MQESVSVIIPTYNSASWINETVQSILKQTYPVLEILVVDDGSTDNTVDVVSSYQNPIKYIYQNHRGVSSARNRGIQMARGDLIAFLDADDYWDPRKIEAQVNLLHDRSLMWVSCETQPFDAITRTMIREITSPMQEGDILDALLLNNFIGSATPIVRKSIFEQVGYFNEAYDARIGEDWDMWLRIASRYPLGVVRERLAFQRLHSDSTMSSTSMAEKVKALEGVIYRAVTNNYEKLKPFEPFALANIYYSAGVQLMKQDQYRDAQSYFFRELRYRPLKLDTVVYLFLTLLGPEISGPILKLKHLLWNRFERIRGKQ